MALIKSISGIRGTIGGTVGNGLSPIDIVKYTAAYAVWVKRYATSRETKIIVGRDARISGEMVNYLVTGTFLGMGINVVNIGMATTPTVEIAVVKEDADGGIILTASHNPKQWNALKLLNNKGEFISDVDGKEILSIADTEGFDFADVNHIGTEQFDNSFLDLHIETILNLQLVDKELIRKAGFKVVVDGVNSVGGFAVPDLLRELGVKHVVEINCNPNGQFPHNPEPLPDHLKDLAQAVVDNQADVGFAVDPDVDRLAIISENGQPFGEEYTLVTVADYVLQEIPGNTVSNLSSTQALRDITHKHGGEHYTSAVGEVNVVAQMKAQNAVIGGEGNGGVIYPELHYGRDALVGIALFMSYLAKKRMKVSELRKTYPNYIISKNKIQLKPQIDVDEILSKIKDKYAAQPVSTEDGVRIEFDKEWVHLRKSNTEPIIRIYAESTSKENANELAQKIIKEINALID